MCAQAFVRPLLRSARFWLAAALAPLLALGVLVLSPWSIGAEPGSASHGALGKTVSGTKAQAHQKRPDLTSRQLVTVTATSVRATTALVQRWQLIGHRWHRVGSPVRAHLGAQGLTAHPSEQLAATPLGTFTLTRTFGAASNAGHRVTRMPYVQARPGLAWGSDPGTRATYNKLYNCHCPQGEFYRLRASYFRYAVLIDYNTAPVRPGAGSGFFLHVTDGLPTAGCVTMPAGELARLLRWLDPAAHPRIAIRVVR